MEHDQGIPAPDLSDDDLERELHHLYETRADTFFEGSQQALDTHTERTLELEQEFQRRFPDRVRPAERRTREGSRTLAGQDPGVRQPGAGGPETR